MMFPLNMSVNMLSNFEQIGVQFGRTQVLLASKSTGFFQEVFDMVDREADGSDSLVESLGKQHEKTPLWKDGKTYQISNIGLSTDLFLCIEIIISF